MESNKINLFNDLKKTYKMGVKLLKEACGELQMIGRQPKHMNH